jgi:cytochrome c peroxidase
MRFRSLAAASLLPITLAAQLPPPFVPTQNPITPAKVILGKFLFWEEQLSSDDSMACGTCHLPEFGGGDPRLDRSQHPGPDKVFGTADDITGSGGMTRQDASGMFVPAVTFGLRRQVTRRNSPTMVGSGHFSELFWDGRAGSPFDDPETGLPLIPFGGALENQALGPILDATEMGHEGRTWNDVRQKLQAATPLQLATNLTPDLSAARQQFPTYPLLFQQAFGDPAITAARIAMALATYQRTLNPDDTPWDRFMTGQTSALTASEQAGWALFQNQGRCLVCHLDPLFADDQFHNLGVRFASEDLGRGALTPVPDDVGAFKTPTLRNSGLRPRLFHNGQSPGLGDPTQLTDPNSTLNLYLRGGGVDGSNLDPFLLPIGLLGVTAADVLLIQDFVRTGLTDQRAALRLPPFDHPDLRSIVEPAPRQFGPSLAGGSEPFVVDTVPSYLGNTNWRLGLVGGQPGSLMVLTYGFSSIEPAGSVVGLPWHVNAIGWQTFFAAGGGPLTAPGRATWPLPIPNDPALSLTPIYVQLLATDAQASTGIASSRGYELFLR